MRAFILLSLSHSFSFSLYPRAFYTFLWSHPDSPILCLRLRQEFFQLIESHKILVGDKNQKKNNSTFLFLIRSTPTRDGPRARRRGQPAAGAGRAAARGRGGRGRARVGVLIFI